MTENSTSGDKPESPKYHPSRTPEQWRAYHRAYYRQHAERRRQQARNSYWGKVLGDPSGERSLQGLINAFLRGKF